MFKMVDVCGGKMTLKEVEREIHNYMLKSPSRLIVDIRLREDVKKKGYYTTLWITRKDFKNKC